MIFLGNFFFYQNYDIVPLNDFFRELVLFKLLHSLFDWFFRELVLFKLLPIYLK